MLSYDSPVVVGAESSKAAVAAVAAAPPQIRQQPSTRMAAPAPEQARGHHHIFLVTGPAGCGKTTVAEHLAQAVDMPYIEGDSYHPKTNIDKMSNGVPLTDADRWDWLTLLREEAIHRLRDGAGGVVVTCSALKRKYRDVIRVAAYFDHSILVHFIYLDAPEEVLLQRVTQRQNHYMGANMVQSQFDILERPSADEKDVTGIDVSRSLDEVKVDALARVRDILAQDAAAETA